MSESAVSAKRFWFLFGAKPAQSETRVRARGQAGVHPEEGAVGRRRAAINFRWIGVEWQALFYLEMGMLCVDCQDVTEFANIANPEC